MTTYKHKVTFKVDSIAHHYEAFKWAEATFGYKDTSSRWGILQHRFGEFRFRFKKDAVFFALRWA